MKLFTIGFTQKNAETFFTRLKQPGLVRLLDARLNNVSQLAGFTKRDDLNYFVRVIHGMEYRHLPLLAPSKAILDAYKKNGGDWPTYERQFLALLDERQIAHKLPQAWFAGGCLLCSEASPAQCHRRLVAEYLQQHWQDVEIIHL
ncbi:MAG: DUF488 domain-containing protein [Magnetococcales bacterium]|nr:DUF488 domain-containing protein [Magnetococcales bacterium]